jgi:hypothetical protein
MVVIVSNLFILTMQQMLEMKIKVVMMRVNKKTKKKKKKQMNEKKYLYEALI